MKYANEVELIALSHSLSRYIGDCIELAMQEEGFKLTNEQMITVWSHVTSEVLSSCILDNENYEHLLIKAILSRCAMQRIILNYENSGNSNPEQLEAMLIAKLAELHPNKKINAIRIDYIEDN